MGFEDLQLLEDDTYPIQKQRKVDKSDKDFDITNSLQKGIALCNDKVNVIMWKEKQLFDMPMFLIYGYVPQTYYRAAIVLNQLKQREHGV